MVLYAQQSLHAQQECQMRAIHYREQRHREIADGMQDLLTQIKVLQLRLSQEAEEVPPIMMSAAGLREADLVSYATLIQDPQFTSRSNLGFRRNRALSCPTPMSKAALELLARHTVWQCKDPVQPAWVDVIGRDREGLMDSVLIVDDPEADEEK